VVDSSSIEVNRRKRRAQSEGLDVCTLVTMLRRSHPGDRGVWRVVHVPSIEAENQRHLHHALETVQQERASTTARLKGLLRSQGIRLTSVHKLPEQRDALRLWDGSPMPSGRRQRVLRVYAHDTFLREQMAALEAERRARLHSAQDANIEKVRQLMQLPAFPLQQGRERRCVSLEPSLGVLKHLGCRLACYASSTVFLIPPLGFLQPEFFRIDIFAKIECSKQTLN
jgi:hypothetical protein